MYDVDLTTKFTCSEMFCVSFEPSLGGWDIILQSYIYYNVTLKYLVFFWITAEFIGKCRFVVYSCAVIKATELIVREQIYIIYSMGT